MEEGHGRWTRLPDSATEVQEVEGGTVVRRPFVPARGEVLTVENRPAWSCKKCETMNASEDGKCRNCGEARVTFEVIGEVVINELKD